MSNAKNFLDFICFLGIGNFVGNWKLGIRN